MGDLISSSLLTGAAGRAAPSPGAVRGGAAADGVWVTTMWPPPAFAECPAFDTRTDDQVPNSPRRTSIAPSSGASLRICTSCAMMLRFIGANRLPGEGVRQSSSTSLNIRSEEHTSELQSQSNLVCRLLLEKKKKKKKRVNH